MKLTEEEKIILKNTDRMYRYIARDKGGDLYIYTSKPNKRDKQWGWGRYDCVMLELFAFNHLFQNVKWEDDEPLEFRNEKGEFIL